MERRERQHRRSATLSDHLAEEEGPCKLQELLKIRDDADDMSALTAVAACARSFESTGGGGGGRMLVEIMREEQEAGEIVVSGNSSNGVNWKSLVACFCLRRAGTAGVEAAAASSSGHASLLPFSTAALARSNSPASTSVGGSTSSASTAASPPDEPPAGGQEISDLGPPASATAAAAAAGVSLMSLLEQTDTQWSNGVEAVSPPLLLPGDDEPTLDDIVADGGAFRVCCVCMMRLKGAAFIPCGHTFCRRCSRELWVNRGSCPLCNDHILEILDIF